MLYRTTKGALFVHLHETTKYKRGKPVVSDLAWELKTPKEAIDWIERETAFVIDDSDLPLPDEA